MNFIKSFDTFGNNLQLNIAGNDTHKTTLGGISSISMFISILFLTWYFGQDMYLREDPLYMSKVMSRPVTPVMKLNSSSFFFRIEDSNGKLFHNYSYFQYDFEYKLISIVIDENTGKEVETLVKSSEIKPTHCTVENVDNKTLHEHELHHYFCANLAELDWGGEYRHNGLIGKFSYFLKKCSPETEKEHNVTCASLFEIENYPEPLYFTYIISETMVDPHDYVEPVKTTYNWYYQNLDLGNVTTNFRFYYSISNIVIDTGFMFNDENESEFLSFEDMTHISTHGISKHRIAKASFYLTKTNKIHYIDYIKVPDVAAQVGGILSLFIPILEYFLAIFIENEYRAFLYYAIMRVQISYPDEVENGNVIDIGINIGNGSSGKMLKVGDNLELKNIAIKNLDMVDNFDNIDFNKSSAIILNDTKKSIKNLKSMNLKGNHNHFKEKDVILNREIDKLISLKAKKANDFQIGDCTRLSYVYCCGKDKVKSEIIYRLICKLEEELDKKCDFIEITKTLDQLRLLKKVVLNKGQCKILNNREFKVITEKELIPDNEVEEIKKEIQEYIKQRKEIGVFNQIDQVLLNYLPKEFKESLNS